MRVVKPVTQILQRIVRNQEKKDGRTITAREDSVRVDRR